MTAHSQSFKRRLLRLMLQWVLVALLVFSVVVALAFRSLQIDADQHRVDLARTVAAAIDSDLNEAALRLARLSNRLPEDGDALRRALREFRVHDRFRHAIMLVGADARPLAVEPERLEASLPSLLDDADAGTPIRLSRDASGTPLIVLEYAFRTSDGARRLVATMDARDSVLNTALIGLVASGERHAAIIDRAGLVVASTHLEHVGLPMSHATQIATGLADPEPTIWHDADSPICADDPQPLLSILVPLHGAAWGVLVQEHQSAAYGEARKLRGLFLLIGTVFAALTGLLALTMSRSIVTPIEALSRRATRMREGDLETPITSRAGDRELKTLALSFETMRRRLRGTLDDLEQLNQQLERKVDERTAQLSERDAELRRLVHRLIDAGEEERRRIARELHDETAQLLTAIQLALDHVEHDAAAVDRARALLTDTQREIHRVIHDLRPTLLDDLGLAAAIRSYTEAHLVAAGLDVQLSIDELPPRDALTDTALFRVFQELVTNILRHAAAARVAIELYTTGQNVRLDVEDDGCGFDVAARAAGVGISGMRERVELVGGTMEIDSEAGMGTHVVVEVPYTR